jgi:hypothetical protein
MLANHALASPLSVVQKVCVAIGLDAKAHGSICITLTAVYVSLYATVHTLLPTIRAFFLSIFLPSF